MVTNHEPSRKQAIGLVMPSRQQAIGLVMPSRKQATGLVIPSMEHKVVHYMIVVRLSESLIGNNMG